MSTIKVTSKGDGMAIEANPMIKCEHWDDKTSPYYKKICCSDCESDHWEKFDKEHPPLPLIDHQGNEIKATGEFEVERVYFVNKNKIYISKAQAEVAAFKSTPAYRLLSQVDKKLNNQADALDKVKKELEIACDTNAVYGPGDDNYGRDKNVPVILEQDNSKQPDNQSEKVNETTTPELIISDDPQSDNLKIVRHEFNDDEDRFVIILGDDSNDCDEDAYRVRFLNINQAKNVIAFLNKNIPYQQGMISRDKVAELIERFLKNEIHPSQIITLINQL